MIDLLNLGRISIPKISAGKENISEISLGRIKLWSNEINITIPYSGIMTVGSNEGSYMYIDYGYMKNTVFIDIGTFDPPTHSIETTSFDLSWNNYGQAITLMFTYLGSSYDQEPNIIYVSINDIEYELAKSPLYENKIIYRIYNINTNPFPAVGETCEIKLDYKPAIEVLPEILIGTQTWMSVNLDIDDGRGGIYAYNHNQNNVATYGRLYTWEAAHRVAASIRGWHLPSEADWNELINYVGGQSEGGKLKESGFEATNTTGFSARFGGWGYPPDTFYAIGDTAYFWSSTETTTGKSIQISLMYSGRTIGINNFTADRINAIRLIKDNS